MSQHLSSCPVMQSQAYSLNLAGVDGDDANAGSNKLLAKTLREAADSSLGGTVDGASNVGLAA